MIVLISALQDSLDSPICERFGRSPYFIKVNTETLEWEAFQNPAVQSPGGAGVASAQLALDHKVDMVMSGDFGPNAVRGLSAAGIGMQKFTDDIKTVKDALARINRSEGV
jgi:predicted Fe-Mo cluster-binding NifX family protein